MFFFIETFPNAHASFAQTVWNIVGNLTSTDGD
jgi:hypothetical protein